MGRGGGHGHFAARRRLVEARFPVRWRIEVPPHGLGDRLNALEAWLNARYGRDGWAQLPYSDGPRHAVELYLPDAEGLAALARWWEAGARA